MLTEIRVSGFGGQGIIRCGYIIGKAAALYNDKNATLTQSFGPEARGSACSAQVIVSDDPILYPYITEPDILIAMGQEAYEKFEGSFKPDGILLTDADLVKFKEGKSYQNHYAIPSTRFAEELRVKIVANIIMLGFFTAITKLITYDAGRKAVEGSVPERFIKLNLKAYDKGYEYGRQLLT